MLTSSGDGLHAKGGTLPIPSDFEDFLRHFSATWSSSGSYTKSPQEEQCTLPRVVSTDRRWPLGMAKMKLNWDKEKDDLYALFFVPVLGPACREAGEVDAVQTHVQAPLHRAAVVARQGLGAAGAAGRRRGRHQGAQHVGVEGGAGAGRAGHARGGRRVRRRGHLEGLEVGARAQGDAGAHGGSPWGNRLWVTQP